ncbi:hypothetical protein ACROYT_G029536 [Oculina patagonica]
MPVDIGFVTGIVVIGITIIGVIGNVLTLFVIIRYEPLRDVTGMFLANLAIADLLQSILGMPLIATSAFRHQWIFGETLCTISGLTNSLFCITSVLTLTAVSVDRWLAIVYPLNYRSWLTVVRARIVLTYIWLQALFVASLPVLGWSRYAYLPYEFICTVQWEYDKPYTIFATVTCFVTPLIVTVVCYAGVMKVACHQSRERPPITVGRFSVSEPDHSTIPDVNKSEVADGEKEKKGKNPGKIVCGKENRAFIEDSESHRDKIEVREAPSRQGKSESTVAKLTEHNNSAMQGPSRVVKIFDQKTDPAHCDFVPGIPGTSKTVQEQAFHMHAERMNERKGKTSVNPSGSIRTIHLDPVVIVLSPENSKIFSGKGKQPAGASINSSGLIGKSRVSPVAVVPPLINRWTEEMPQRMELKVIREEDEKKDSKKCFTSRIRSARLPGHLARMRSWMSERRTEDGRQRRKEMKVALILLVVNGTFIICWLPHFVGMMCLTFTDGSCPFPDSFFIITTTLAMLNSGCNPFIYTLTYRKFRKAFKRVLPCFRSDHTGNMETSVN